MTDEQTLPVMDDFIFSFEATDKLPARQYFRADKAAAYLLDRGVLQLGSVKYILNDWEPQDQWRFSEQDTIALQVNCNDVFAWGCSDSEDIDYAHILEDDVDNELYDLLRMYLENQRWGPVKWIALKCNMAPQSPMVKAMIADGAWDEELQALPHNSIDDSCCDWHRNTAKQNQTTLT